MPDEIVSESKSILRLAFDRFRAGHKRLGQIALGLLIASWMTIGCETGFRRHVYYNFSDLHIQVLFWAMGAGFGLWLLFTQNKFESWRAPLGGTEIEDRRDWAVFIASIAVCWVFLTALSRALA